MKLIFILMSTLIMSQWDNVYCMEESQETSNESSSEISSVHSSAIESSALELEHGENTITFAYPSTMTGIQASNPQRTPITQTLLHCKNKSVSCIKENPGSICCCCILVTLVGIGFVLEALYNSSPSDY